MNIDRFIIVGDKIKGVKKSMTMLYQEASLCTFNEEDNYLVVIHNGNNIQKVARYSPQRVLLESNGFTPIMMIDCAKYLHTRFESIVEQFGEMHLDTGSGSFIPSFLTNDAYLYCFYVEDSFVTGIIQKDLFSNMVVSEYC